MNKLIVFGASNSERSINRIFANWVASQIEGIEFDSLDLNKFEMPIYSVDREKADAIPGKAVEFKERIDSSSGIIISFAEYNGSYKVGFKNIFDWISRVRKPIWSNKPMFLLATSPGPRGARTVLDLALRTFPHQGGQVAAKFSLPSFRQNFDLAIGIIDGKLKMEFDQQRKNFEETVLGKGVNIH